MISGAAAVWLRASRNIDSAAGSSPAKKPQTDSTSSWRIFAPPPRMYVFGQNQYFRDTFKSIDYLIAPTGGIGYKLFDTAQTKLSVDGGLGVVWEKNPGFDVDSSGAVTSTKS